jgi:uncharacterized protein DUF5753
MTQAALAKAIYASDSLVAAWESGRRVPKPKYESVLRRPVGGPGVMREQLTHLLEVAERPDVALQIVPSGVGAYPGLAGGFLILGFDGREAVYVDDAFSGDIIEAVDEIATMKRVWEALRVEALPGKQSVDLLAEVIPQRKRRRHMRRGRPDRARERVGEDADGVVPRAVGPVAVDVDDDRTPSGPAPPGGASRSSASPHRPGPG